jgi:hypothetical protein
VTLGHNGAPAQAFYGYDFDSKLLIFVEKAADSEVSCPQKMTAGQIELMRQLMHKCAYPSWLSAESTARRNVTLKIQEPRPIPNRGHNLKENF